MGEVTGLAYKLNLPIEEVIALMLKLDIPVDSPDYILTTKDVKKIKKYLRKNNNSYLKDTLVAGVAIMSIYFMFSPIGNFIMGINNNEPLAFTTAISVENDYPVESRSSNYYMLSNECTPVDYADTDFLVVENIKVFLSNNEYYTGTIDDVFDEELKDSVKDFQKDMGIRIDGVVGPTTHKIMQNYNSCTKKSIENLISCYGGDYKAYLECTSPYESSTVLTTTTLDSNPPKWAEDPLTIININSSWMSPNVMRATVLWGHVTDDVGIDEYQIYVDGKLYTTIPGLNCKTKCSSQSSGRNARISDLVKDNYHTIEVRACDEAGNCSTDNPTMTKQFKKTVEVATTTTTLPGTPSITITASEVSDGDTSSDSSLSLTFTSSESTTDFTAGDVSVSGGTLSNFSGSGTTYTATFTPTAQGATTIDVAGGTFTNASTGIDNTAATQFNWTYSTAPTITITASEVSDGGTSSDSSLSVTFTASQSTTNFAAGDVTVSGGTLSNFSGSGTTYTATFTPSALGATTIDVAGGTFTNTFGTNNTAATQFNWTYSTGAITVYNNAEVGIIPEIGDQTVSPSITINDINNYGVVHIGVNYNLCRKFDIGGESTTRTMLENATQRQALINYMNLGGVVWLNVEWWNEDITERACSDRSNINAMLTLLGTEIRAIDDASIYTSTRSTETSVINSNFPTTQTQNATVIFSGGTPVFVNGSNTITAYEKIGLGILYVSGDSNTFNGPSYPQSYYNALRSLVNQ